MSSLSLSRKLILFILILNISTIDHFSILKCVQKLSDSDDNFLYINLGVYIKLNLNSSPPSKTVQFGNISRFEVYFFRITDVGSFVNEAKMPFQKQIFLTLFNKNLEKINEIFLHSSTDDKTSQEENNILFLIDLKKKETPVSIKNGDLIPITPLSLIEENITKLENKKNKFYFSILTRNFKYLTLGNKIYIKLRTKENLLINKLSSHRFGFILKYYNVNKKISHKMVKPSSLDTQFLKETVIFEYSELNDSQNNLLNPIYDRLKELSKEKYTYEVNFNSQNFTKKRENLVIFQNSFSMKKYENKEDFDESNLDRIKEFFNKENFNNLDKILVFSIFDKLRNEYLLGVTNNTKEIQNAEEGFYNTIDDEKVNDVSTSMQFKGSEGVWIILIFVLSLIILCLFLVFRKWLADNDKLIL